MQEKICSKNTLTINFPNCCRTFLLFCNFHDLEVVTSSASNNFVFWDSSVEFFTIFGRNDVTAFGHWELTGKCRPIRSKNEVWMYNSSGSSIFLFNHANIVSKAAFRDGRVKQYNRIYIKNRKRKIKIVLSYVTYGGLDTVIEKNFSLYQLEQQCFVSSLKRIYYVLCLMVGSFILRHHQTWDFLSYY